MLREQKKKKEKKKETKIISTIECTLKQKWTWARHIARMKDNRRTKNAQTGN